MSMQIRHLDNLRRGFSRHFGQLSDLIKLTGEFFFLIPNSPTGISASLFGQDISIELIFNDTESRRLAMH